MFYDSIFKNSRRFNLVYSDKMKIIDCLAEMKRRVGSQRGTKILV